MERALGISNGYGTPARRRLTPACAFCAACSFKSGKVVVLLQGRYAGRKAVIVKAHDEGTQDRKFGHAVVAGLDRYPRKITKGMSQKTIKKRSQMKPFIKHVNYTHLMPTRYQCDFDIKKIVDDASKEKDGLKASGEVRKHVKQAFSKKYHEQATAKLKEKQATGLKYFYTKLRF
jgi:large subunit ribosomal protein L27e